MKLSNFKALSVFALAAIVAVVYLSESKATDLQRVRSCVQEVQIQRFYSPVQQFSNHSQFEAIIVERPVRQFREVQRYRQEAPAILRIEQPRHRQFRAIELQVKPVRRPVIEIRNRGLFNRKQRITIR